MRSIKLRKAIATSLLAGAAVLTMSSTAFAKYYIPQYDEQGNEILPSNTRQTTTRVTDTEVDEETGEVTKTKREVHLNPIDNIWFEGNTVCWEPGSDNDWFYDVVLTGPKGILKHSTPSTCYDLSYNFELPGTYTVYIEVKAKEGNMLNRNGKRISKTVTQADIDEYRGIKYYSDRTKTYRGSLSDEDTLELYENDERLKEIIGGQERIDTFRNSLAMGQDFADKNDGLFLGWVVAQDDKYTAEQSALNQSALNQSQTVSTSNTAQQSNSTPGYWWQDSDGSWKFNISNGPLAANEWILTNGVWYHIGANSCMDTGLMVDTDGKAYYLEPANGAMVTGWKELADTSGVKHWYYFDNSGAMVKSGTVTDPASGKQYSFDAEGKMK